MIRFWRNICRKFVHRIKTEGAQPLQQLSFHFLGHETRERLKSKSGLLSFLLPPSSSSADCGSDGLGVRTKWLVATTESSSKRGEVALTTDATSPPAGFTPHYRSSTNSRAPWEKEGDGHCQCWARIVAIFKLPFSLQPPRQGPASQKLFAQREMAMLSAGWVGS